MLLRFRGLYGSGNHLRRGTGGNESTDDRGDGHSASSP
jgi:hypothetical protein